MKPSIALFGATGPVGRSIANALNAAEHPYRVVGRTAASLEKAFGGDPLAEITTWDPDCPASIVAAAESIDTLIYMVGVPYDQFHLHPVLMQKTIDGAVEAGVKHILLIGTLYPFGMPQAPLVSAAHPREPHTYKGSKRKEQEDVLMQADRSGRIRATILRLPDFYGPGVERSFVHGVFTAIASGGAAQMISPVDVPHEFVFIPDVGPVVVKAALEPKAYGRTWNLGGVGTITQRDFAQRAFAMGGRKPRIQTIGKTLLRLIGFFNPVMREMVEMHYLLAKPIIVDDRALSELLGGLEKTSYDEGIRQCLPPSNRTS